MSNREQRIEAEVIALWREFCDDPPPAPADVHQVLEQLLRRLPKAEYERLNSRFLEGSRLTWPKRE